MIFTRYGIPEDVVCNDCPRYSSETYAAFTRQFQFEHMTGSPHYPQSSGEAEWAVQTEKPTEKGRWPIPSPTVVSIHTLEVHI